MFIRTNISGFVRSDSFPRVWSPSLLMTHLIAKYADVPTPLQYVNNREAAL